MRVLVTGGCGFIGSALASRLVKEGHIVDIVDNLSNGDLSNLTCDFKAIHPSVIAFQPIDHQAKENIANVITGDFADPTIFKRVSAGEYDVVYHTAANPRVQYSVEHPVESHEENTYKSIALFKVAADSSTRVVFSSSSAIYGEPESIPTGENTTKNPESPYGLQKLHCEHYLKMFESLFDLKSVSLRYFNVYGPRAYGDSPYATAIAAWCHAIHDGRPLRSDGDGSQTRDLVYVDDVVRANLLAGSCEDIRGAVRLNIASGESYSNNEILGMLKKKFGDLEITHAPARPGDVQNTLGTTNDAREIINFETKITLTEGLEKTIEWWKSLK